MKRLWQKNELTWLLVVGVVTSISRATPSPIVFLRGNSIVGQHAENQRPLNEGIYIAETEDCVASPKGKHQVDFSQKCQYLRGLYRYVFLAEGDPIKHQILLGFSVSKNTPSGHVLLTEMPIEITENEFNPVNSSE